MRLIIVLILSFTFAHISAQNTKKLNGHSPDATLDQVSWIAGHWKGEAFGGIVEEVWTPPLGDSMMGSFKLVNDGKVSFYEICTIRKVENSLTLQLKHFHGDLKGWEEKDETVDFPLVEIGDRVVYFDQLTFRKIDDHEMHVFVVVSDGGSASEVPFKYFRVKD
ncbi:MAG: hypothetical protein HKN68_11430 [Saprospiraceae bacterium]|nr:hypothetical protein [Saprospiraceae bacterium]